MIQIDVKIAGADDFTFTANTFTANSGSSIVVPDGGLTFGSTAISSTAAELNILDGKAFLDEDDMSSNSATGIPSQQSVKAYVDAQQDTVDTFAEVLALSNTTSGTDIAVSTGDDITFADSSKAIFGAGPDLRIYHDGSNSYINDTSGTGNLYIASNQLIINNAANSENMARFAENGAVTLYYDNAAKLATTATGIDVTGVITTDGMTTSADINFGDSDKAIFGAGSDLQIYHDGDTSYISHNTTGTDLVIEATSPGDDVIVRAADDLNFRVNGNENGIVVVGDGATSLYHAN